MVQLIDLKRRNRWLAALSDDDAALLADHCRRVHLTRDQVLIEAGEPAEHVHFLEDGIASVVSVDREGNRTELAVIGREGFSGLMGILGDATSPFQTFMQVGDAPALEMRLTDFHAAMKRSPTLARMGLRFATTLAVQAAGTVMSHARHRLESRLARWLLMCHDRLDGDEVHLTHAFLSMMVAAQRTGVTMALHMIEGAGIIRARRGVVSILDRPRLEELAGELYGSAESEYRRLIAPFGKTASATPLVEVKISL